MAVNKKILSIEIMRIIAALGVFTGHFLGIGIASEFSLGALRYMRSSAIGKSVLAYAFEGDISVIFFYVVGGFFITYNFYTRNYNNKKIQQDFLRKICEIVIPGISVILITAFLSYSCYKLGISSFFSWSELKSDLIKILFGGGRYHSILCLSALVYPQNGDRIFVCICFSGAYQRTSAV